MENRPSVFEKTVKDYLAQIGRLHLEDIAQKTGCEWTGQALVIPLFGEHYTVSLNDIVDPSGKTPDHSIITVLCQYLLRYPQQPPEDDTWVSYKDFRDAAPLLTFQSNTEADMARYFTGKLKILEKACAQLGGEDYVADLDYDLHMKFDALPGIPMLLLFNDADDEFPAKSLCLFERRAEDYLDMECVAILGRLLVENLLVSSGIRKKAEPLWP